MEKQFKENEMRLITNENQMDLLTRNDVITFMTGSDEGSETGSEENSDGGSGSAGSISYNNCYFNTLYAIGNKYGLEVTKEKLHDNYFDDSFWNHPGTEEEKNIGPYSEKELDNGTRIPNPDAHEYINKYFETVNTKWEEDTDKIAKYCNKNSGTNKGYVIGVIELGEGFNDHVVILTNAQGNDFLYNDPTSGESGKIVRIDKIRWATKVIGLKKEEKK